MDNRLAYKKIWTNAQEKLSQMETKEEMAVDVLELAEMEPGIRMYEEESILVFKYIGNTDYICYLAYIAIT